MKKTTSLLLAFILLFLLLPACGDAPVDEPDIQTTPDVQTLPVQEMSLQEMVEAIWDAAGGGQEETAVALDDSEQLALYLENAYGLEAGQWEDSAVMRAAGASAVELAVVLFAGEDAAKDGAARLKDYLHTREGDFTGYAPDQAQMVADAAVVQYEAYVGLFICGDSKGAAAVFEAILKGETVLPEPEPDESEDPHTAVMELRDFMVSRQEIDEADLTLLDARDAAALEDYVADNYGLTRDQWEACAIAYMSDRGAQPFEIAVFQVNDRTRLDTAVRKSFTDALADYLYEREEEFSGTPEWAATLHDDVFQLEQYIVLAACADSSMVVGSLMFEIGAASFSQFVRHNEDVPVTPPASDEPSAAPVTDPEPSPAAEYPGRISFIQPNKDDMSIYDTSAIRAAWETGDVSGLSDYDRAICDAAQTVLEESLRDGMSDLEKETAIYSWIVNNVNYDWTHQDVMAETPRESFTPYGGLVNRRAVCLGYAASFQLLMDLAGVECITVPGAAYNSEEDHAWNMVRLNGNWYCVDVTWDANYRELGTSSGADWYFFNITSDRMALLNHQWDYGSTPEATATDYGQG